MPDGGTNSIEEDKRVIEKMGRVSCKSQSASSMLRVNWYIENGSLCRRVWDFQNERWRKHEEIGLIEAAGMLQRLENESLSSNKAYRII